MRTRRNKTRRGGGPKKTKSASTKKKDPDREFEETVEMINLLNTKYSETGVKTGDVEKLISALEDLIPSKGFNAKQKMMLKSILDINEENTINCQLLNPKKRDCDFLEGFVDRIAALIGPDSPPVAIPQKVIKPAPFNESFAAIMKKNEPIKSLSPPDAELPKKPEPPKKPESQKNSPLIPDAELPKKSETRKHKKKSRKSHTEPLIASVLKPPAEPLIASVLKPPAEPLIASVLKPPAESVEFGANSAPNSAPNSAVAKSKTAAMITNETVARTFIKKYVFPNIKDENNELTELRETGHTEDLCVFLKSLFPSFQIKSSKHKTILCTMLFLIGKLSYLLNMNYAIGAGDYYILVKGGTALKLMANHPEFIYESEDIDLLVMTRPGIPYDQDKLSDFVDGLANYVKWFLNDPQIIIEPQKGGLKVLKLYYGKHGLCDIDYQDHSAEDTHMFYENVHTILHKNHKLLFNYQREDDFYREKVYLYQKYKHECTIHECDKEENKKNPECRLCLYLQTKFEKSIKAMTRLNFLRR